MQGIWAENSDGTDINALNKSPDDKLLATSDDYGRIKIFRYPCLSKTANYVSYQGHSREVTNVEFGASGKVLFSTGGADKSIF